MGKKEGERGRGTVVSVVSVGLIVSALKKMGTVEGERGPKKPLSVVSVVSVGLAHRPERKNKKKPRNFVFLISSGTKVPTQGTQGTQDFC